MSYESKFSGSIKIDPPLTRGMVEGSPFLRPSRAVQLKFVGDQAVAVEATEPSMSGTSGPLFREQLQELVDAYPTHQFTESIHCVFAFGVGFIEGSSETAEFVVNEKRRVDIKSRGTRPPVVES